MDGSIEGLNKFDAGVLREADGVRRPDGCELGTGLLRGQDGLSRWAGRSGLEL